MEVDMPPKRKTTTKKSSKKAPKIPQTQDLTIRLVLFSSIIFMLTIVLVFVWSQLPQATKVTPEPAPTVQTSQPQAPELKGDNGITKGTCEAGGGHWIDCGNPCHGNSGEVCAQVCEPQCECGGIAGWSCPNDFTCTDYEPAAGTPDALGVCRQQISAPEEAAVEPSALIREQPAGMVCDDLNFICVDDSVQNSTLANPFTITGSGIAFENTIHWRLLDGDGKLLEEGNTNADAPDVGQAGNFEIRNFILSVPETATGTLEVFEYSAKDGTPTHSVHIPVRVPQRAMNVHLYLSPMEMGTNCSEVTQITETVAPTNLPVEATLRKLLRKDPNSVDQQAQPGYGTHIPKGTQLISLKVSGGTATAMFSSELENDGGGSCNAEAIRAEIEQTLKQFSSVHQVVISVEGKTPEESLQP